MKIIMGPTQMQLNKTKAMPNLKQVGRKLIEIR
jgi:hypothetical protein